jgi:hypothetical protein
MGRNEWLATLDDQGGATGQLPQPNGSYPTSQLIEGTESTGKMGEGAADNRVSVAVMDESGRPVAAAVVRIRLGLIGYEAGSREIECDQRGMAVVRGLPRYAAILACKPGVGISDEYEWDAMHQPVDSCVRLTLKAVSMLSITVLDGNGVAVNGASLVCSPSAYSKSGEMTSQAATLTDSHGECTIVFAGPFSGTVHAEWNDVVTGSIFRSVELGEIDDVCLRAASRFRIDIVVDVHSSKLFVGGAVEAWTAGEPEPLRAVLDTGRRGLLSPMTSGIYALQVTAPGFVHRERVFTRVEDVSPIQLVTITMVEAGSIQGVLRLPNGEPAFLERVTASCEQTPQLNESEERLFRYRQADMPSGFTDKNGRFEIRGLNPEHTYSLECKGYGATLIQGVRPSKETVELTLDGLQVR